MLHAEDAGAGDGRAWDRSGRWLAALAGLALAVSWAQALLSACRWDRVDSSTGAYAAIAADMQHGIWYAPLLADDALGGTRYMPLFPWLTSLVANATPTVIDAGLLVAFVSAVGAALCVGWLAWRHTGSRTVGVLATALVTASQVWRDVAAAGRSDATAVLLNLLGLAVLGAGRARQVLLAGLCFGLATLTKFTDVWGLAAVTLWALRHRHWRLLLGVHAVHAAVLVAAVAGIDGLLAGHLVESFRACATVRSLSPSDILNAPILALNLLLQYDPLFLLPFGLAVAPLLRRERLLTPTAPLDLAWVPALFLMVLACTMSFAERNHLIDFQVLVALGLATALPGAAARTPWIGGALATYLLLSLGMVLVNGGPQVSRLPSFRQQLQATSPRDEMRAAAALLRSTVPGPGPILCDHLPPVLTAGVRPFALDPWMVGSLQNATGTAQRARVADGLERRRFAAVVLGADPEQQAPLLDRLLGDGFTGRLLAHYTRAAADHGVCIYLPRG